MLIHRYFLRPLVDVEVAYKSGIQAILHREQALQSYQQLKKKDIVFGKIYDNDSPPPSHENDNRIVFSLGIPLPPSKRLRK